ncbi:hypothetical protein G9A89_003208 [Geosiphon pyriformis]|nr:hypothetical protein G9A89_003208 [Geosiphon pyriformis]
MVVHQSIFSSSHQQSRSCQQNLGTDPTQNLNFQHYLSLLVTPENTTSSNLEIEQQQPSTNNILPATITENESLDAIFPFELEELSNALKQASTTFKKRDQKPSVTAPLFSGAVLEEKLITAMYTNAKVNGHFIKLILDSYRIDHATSARIITADRATKTPIGKINDFSIEVNGIIVPIKVLVMEATQYQALVGNNWLSKTNTMLNWMTQELVLSQNSQYTQVPATCSHFKATNTTALLIDLEEEKPKPTWEVYQVLWADKEHNKLPPILLWDNNSKGKQKRTEPIWNANQA